jgi:hypothetical protein
MIKQAVHWRSVVYGLVELSVSIAIIFLLPVQIFLVSSRRNGDLIFQGLALIFGEVGARYFCAFPFLVMCIFSFRRAFSEQNKSSKINFPSRLRGRKSREKGKIE